MTIYSTVRFWSGKCNFVGFYFLKEQWPVDFLGPCGVCAFFHRINTLRFLFL